MQQIQMIESDASMQMETVDRQIATERTPPEHKLEKQEGCCRKKRRRQQPLAQKSCLIHSTA